MKQGRIEYLQLFVFGNFHKARKGKKERKESIYPHFLVAENVVEKLAKCLSHQREREREPSAAAEEETKGRKKDGEESASL